MKRATRISQSTNQSHKNRSKTTAGSKAERHKRVSLGAKKYCLNVILVNMINFYNFALLLLIIKADANPDSRVTIKS